MTHTASTTVQLPQPVYNDIIAHAREGKPEEVCGIVRGDGLIATSSKRARNVAENRIIFYDVDPQTLLEFVRNEDEMVGVYHSHPESPAYPSATDAWIAEYPNKIYFICSLQYDDAPVLRGFRMETHFLDLDLPALRQGISFYETRPNLFAYYQPADALLPTVLRDLGDQVALPFYVVYYSADGVEFESRVVTITEYAIDVVCNA